MITINQSPTFPNIANNDLLWVVESTEISQPQFQFVVDIKDENDVLIQRVKQQPNPQGYGVFNLKNIISNQFDNEYTYEPLDWYTNKIKNSNIPSQKYLLSSKSGGATKEINVYIGEEYAVSTTATSSLYDGYGSVGSPAVSASSTDWQIYMNGVLDTNNRFPLWSGSWNFTTEFDKYVRGTFTQPAGYFLPYSIYEGKGKWNPMPLIGVYDANSQNVEFDDNFPPNNLYTFNVGLTDFPTTRSVRWDDVGTISFLQGTDLSPQYQIDNPLEIFPKGQFIYDAQIYWYDIDGGVRGSTHPVNRDILMNYPNQNFITEARFSQSVDDTMLHVPCFPQNYMMWASGFRNPSAYPTNYTIAYEIRFYGMRIPNQVGFSNNYVSGSTRTGYDAPEFGSLAYEVPLILFDLAVSPTGSYPASTAKLWVRGTTGGDCMVHFTQSDALYPDLDFPIASPIQIVKDINTQCEASGSSVRAWLIDNPQYPYGLSPEFASKDYSKYHVMIGDNTNSGVIFNQSLQILTSGSSGDVIGTLMAGENSCLGIGTGRYSSIDFSTFDYENIYTTGSNVFYSTFDSRMFEVDWSGYNDFFWSSNASCGYEHKQFMWKNKYGAFDYYTFTLAQTITNDIERQQYEQSFVNYNSTSLLPFDKSRRGTTQYYNKITQRHIVESDWLTQEEADAIKELFFSTMVYEIQKQNTADISGAIYGSSGSLYPERIEYIPTNLAPANSNTTTLPQSDNNGNSPTFQTQQVPVVITNAQLIEKTNPRTQKLYKVSVEFVYANDLNARL